MSTNNRAEIMEMATEIVCAYVSHHSVEAEHLPRLLSQVVSALASAGDLENDADKRADLTPAVPIKKSVMPDYIVCLEDGKRFKSLKRHLKTRYGMSPDEYRQKWGLPSDYPMVAPNYAKARSELAKRSGLGLNKGGPSRGASFSAGE